MTGYGSKVCRRSQRALAANRAGRRKQSGRRSRHQARYSPLKDRSVFLYFSKGEHRIHSISAGLSPGSTSILPLSGNGTKEFIFRIFQRQSGVFRSLCHQENAPWSQETLHSLTCVTGILGDQQVELRQVDGTVIVYLIEKTGMARCRLFCRRDRSEVFLGC